MVVLSLILSVSFALALPRPQVGAVLSAAENTAEAAIAAERAAFAAKNTGSAAGRAAVAVGKVGSQAGKAAEVTKAIGSSNKAVEAAALIKPAEVKVVKPNDAMAGITSPKPQPPKQIAEFPVKVGPFQISKAPIGQGLSGQVFKTSDPAVFIKKLGVTADITEEKIRLEANIIKLLGRGKGEIFREGDNFYIPMKRIPGDSMNKLNFYKKGLNDKIPAYEQAKSQLDRLHQLGYLHDDINWGNIMIDVKTGEANLIDFGSARKLSSSSKPNLKDFNDMKLESDDLLMKIFTPEEITKLKGMGLKTIQAEYPGMVVTNMVPTSSINSNQIKQIAEILQKLGRGNGKAIEKYGVFYLPQKFIPGKPIKAVEFMKRPFKERQMVYTYARSQVEQLHKLGYTHNSVKLQNILIDDAGKVNLANFEKATKLSGELPQIQKQLKAKDLTDLRDNIFTTRSERLKSQITSLL